PDHLVLPRCSSECCDSSSIRCCRACCSLSTPLPPRSTLFPYTTLFRSGIEYVPELKKVYTSDWWENKIGVISLPERKIIKKLPTDRKSTRLNSSHGSSSYAVFCLTKKISTWTGRVRRFVPQAIEARPAY